MRGGLVDTRTQTVFFDISRVLEAAKPQWVLTHAGAKTEQISPVFTASGGLGHIEGGSY